MIKHKHKGANAELRAAAWLLEQGYEVFRNVSPYGEVDLVAIKDGQTRMFDVKYGYRGGSPRDGIEYISPMADGTFKIMGRARTRSPFIVREMTPREIVLRKLSTSAQ